MPDKKNGPVTHQELAEVAGELREELRDEIRGVRAEFRWLFGLLLAALIGGSAILLPLALDRVTAEIRAATSEAVRTLDGEIHHLEGDIRYLEGRVDATE